MNTLDIADKLKAFVELEGGDLGDIDDAEVELRRLHTAHTKLQADYDTLHAELIKTIKEVRDEIADILREAQP